MKFDKLIKRVQEKVDHHAHMAKSEALNAIIGATDKQAAGITLARTHYARHKATEEILDIIKAEILRMEHS